VDAMFVDLLTPSIAMGAMMDEREFSLPVSTVTDAGVADKCLRCATNAGIGLNNVQPQRGPIRKSRSANAVERDIFSGRSTNGSDGLPIQGESWSVNRS
jgi:hypothetical protein